MGLGVALDRLLPLNKNLWTSTYALFMSGVATAAFAACHWLIDTRGLRRGTSCFSIYGENALTFVWSGIVGKLLVVLHWTPPSGERGTLRAGIYRLVAEPLASPKYASILYALGFMLALYAVARLIHRRGWIVKV